MDPYENWSDITAKTAFLTLRKRDNQTLRYVIYCSGEHRAKVSSMGSSVGIGDLTTFDEL